MRPPLPVEIVGGGLSGLSLGLALRRKGIPVTIFEAHRYPRHRVCGEFISGLDDRAAASLGMDEFLCDAHPHRSVTYYLRGKPLRPFCLPRAALGISRHTLDARIARAFVAAGGELRTDTKVAEADTPQGRVFAAGRKRKGPFWVGLKVHVGDLELVNDFEVHLGERCYVGLSRIEDGDINVCGIFAPREHSGQGIEILYSYLEAAGLCALSQRIRGAKPDPESFCSTAATLGDRSIPHSARVLVGDACASIPPFTGNGLAMAIQGAGMAVGPLAAYSAGDMGWADAARAIESSQKSQFRRRLALASLLHPFFLEPIRQRCLAAVVGSGLVPFSAFYTALR